MSATPVAQEAGQDSDEELHLSDDEGGLQVDGIYIPPPPKAYCSAETKGPRLIITHITNNFFKSYADTQILGPFHKCFNAIVGPNGSGKSNVIDSMLFVFGYRASKIRSKKISVLLHNSEKYRNVQCCTVSVHFAEIIDKEGDKYDIVPGSEFTVSRTAYKDNSSSYTLNGTKTQFKEIAVLLRKHGIDLDHNRFLILQGEVEQISLMSPKGTDNDPGMLEYLEDIIGTSRYKIPLVQLSDRIEILSEQRSEKLNRLKLVQNELNELKEPMEEAVQFLKLENCITSTKNFYYQKHIQDLQLTVGNLDENKTKVEAMLEDVNTKINKISEEKSSRLSILKETSSKYEKLEIRKNALKEAFEKANTKDIQLQADMTQTNRTRKKTKELLLEEQKRLETYNKTPQSTEKQINIHEKNEVVMISKKQALEEEKNKLLANLRDQTKDLQEKKEVLQTKLVDLNKIVDDTKSSYTLAESELKIYTSNYDNEKNKFENLQKICNSSEINMTQKLEESEKLRKLIPVNENKLQSANQELDTIKREESELIGNLRQKRSQLEETRSSMQASRSRGRVLDALIQQKREGKCPGLFGRLGDLGAIDPKYDVAVSTACGALENIVVDTVNTAQWCIEFLKKHDIGRATIIALEKQEHLRRFCNSTIKTPENVPRLFDLIRVEDERVRPAFYYALRDTLVADHLDQGSRIAYGAQRYRVVTLGGDLIETTGTMAGGGKQVSKGRMGQSVAASNLNAQDIEIMEHDVYNLEKRLKELRQRETVLATDVSNLTPEVRQMKITFQKYTLELQSLKQQFPQLKVQLKTQEAKLKATTTDPAKINELNSVVNNTKMKYDEALSNASVLQKQVDVITKEITEMSRGKMRVVDKNLKDITNSIEMGKADLAKLKVGIKTAQRNAVKSSEKITTMQEDITQMENRLRQLKTERDEIETDAKKLLACIEEISGRLADIEEFHDLKKEVDKLTKTENSVKAEKIEIEEKFKMLNGKLDDLMAKIHQWRVKITQLKYQDIPDTEKQELKTYTEEELNDRQLQSVQKELQAYEQEFRGANPNLNAITEYSNKQKIFITRSKELDVVTEQRKKIRGFYDGLCMRRKEEFVTGYDIIKAKLKEMYQMITLGGDADFEMLDTFDPFSEGIQFRVRPPKKTWKLISNLSGGEKTLSSLALVFALHYYKPSPLYVMDEIDAALDFKNVSIVGNYIKERTKNAQFVIISLRSNMFELCDYLIGIYKTFNCTKSVSIDPRLYDQNQEKPTSHEKNNEKNNVKATQIFAPSQEIVSMAVQQSTEVDVPMETN